VGAKSSERVRLFVALELPAAARAELEQWRSNAVRAAGQLRLVAPEALHTTLCFLGWRSADEIERIGAACADALGRRAPPALDFSDPLWLPRHRPRVLAVGLDDRTGSLKTIQAGLSASLSAGGWYEPEARPFLPHVTVARVSGRARVKPVELTPLRSLEFDGDAVTLYRSRLERAGARYETLRRIEFSS
jgi:RNA 2',3'-cyclic 3'-phosphodiesterase